MAAVKCPKCGADGECFCRDIDLGDIFQYTLFCKKCCHKEEKYERNCPFCGQAQREHLETPIQCW
ncbi:hypothetical protein KJA13_01430 [Patescibacteria group bacterium]|nr:hypothetical protein [Patescibacteria group bacterium]